MKTLKELLSKNRTYVLLIDRDSGAYFNDDNQGDYLATITAQYVDGKSYAALLAMITLP